MNMECPLCDSNALSIGESFKEFNLITCSSCRVQFWHPLVSDHSFYEHSDMYVFEKKRKLGWNHKLFFKKYKKYKNGGKKLLDIAFGQGEFLGVANKKGFEVCGIDWQRRNVEMVMFNWKLKNVFCKSIEDIVVEKIGTFDFITAFELIEHLQNPKILLDAVKRNLASGGVFILSTPNALRYGGVVEIWDYPPNHLFRFSKNSLISFLERNNFKVEEIVEEPLNVDFFLNRFSNTSIMQFLRKQKGVSLEKGIGPVSIDSDFNSKKNENNIKKAMIKMFFKKARTIKDVLFKIILWLPIEILRLIGKKYWGMIIIAKLKS